MKKPRGAGGATSRGFGINPVGRYVSPCAFFFASAISFLTF